MVTKGELDAIVYLTEPSHRLDRVFPCGSFVDEYVLNASRPLSPRLAIPSEANGAVVAVVSFFIPGHTVSWRLLS
jgi:hypothetical protein